MLFKNETITKMGYEITIKIMKFLNIFQGAAYLIPPYILPAARNVKDIRKFF